MERGMEADDRPVRKTHSEPLPASSEKVVALVKRVLQLPRVQEIRITPTTFEVTRLLDPAEAAVIPEADAAVEIDFDFLLTRLRVLEEVPFSPDTHPYIALVQATQHIATQRLIVSALFAPTSEALEAYFGLDENPGITHFMGIPVIFHHDERYPMKLLVVGGPTSYVSDATAGIIIDIGV